MIWKYKNHATFIDCIPDEERRKQIKEGIAVLKSIDEMEKALGIN